MDMDEPVFLEQLGNHSENTFYRNYCPFNYAHNAPPYFLHSLKMGVKKLQGWQLAGNTSVVAGVHRLRYFPSGGQYAYINHLYGTKSKKSSFMSS